MSIAKRGADGFYALRLNTLLTMPFNKWAAHDDGVIDSSGNVLRKPETSREKSNFTSFHNVVRNIKRLVHKVPGGRTILGYGGSFLTMLEDIRDEYELSDEFVELVQEAMAASDAGGNVDDIASGVNNGPITHPGPKVMKDRKKRKHKRFKHFVKE